jgi:DNA-3-methyladenine glycosylase
VKRSFFARDAVTLARELLGTHLVHEIEGSARIGRIVETEAYCGPDDAACHARFGRTERTRALFGPPGHAYVFLIYGMYDCFNVVGLAEGEGHAVLVRAVEPVSGIAGRTDGPGRLTRAMGLSRAHNGASLQRGPVRIEPGTPPARIAITARVGVAYAGDDAALPYRFVDAGSAHVSRPAARLIGRPSSTPPAGSGPSSSRRSSR